jgi:hypothetical protein
MVDLEDLEIIGNNEYIQEDLEYAKYLENLNSSDESDSSDDESDKKGHVYSIKPSKLTNWSGEILRKDALKLLHPGLIVRTVITTKNPNDKTSSNNSTEAVYVTITKIKDGTVWGITENTYRTMEYYGNTNLPSGSIHKFPLKNVSEIPFQWYPKNIQKKFEKYIVECGTHSFVTGLTSI